MSKVYYGIHNTYFGMRGIDDLLSDILEYGVEVPNERTGTSTLALFDAKIILEGDYDFVTNRLASPRLAFEEMMFFLRGETDTKILEEKGVNFWRGNTSREFLDARGLQHLPAGDIGAAYSAQWRKFGGYYDYGQGSVDQLANLIDGLRDDKYGRRHLVTLWNPLESDMMALTPCHHTSQYVVLPDGDGNDVLHVKLINRSLDVAFGTAFALYQYRMLQVMLCEMFGFKMGRLSLDISHAHVYDNQIEYVKELLSRTYEESDNSLTFNKDITTLDDLLSVEWSDWEMVYKYNDTPFKTPRPQMVA